MADLAKCAPINGGALFSDFKTHFSILRAKRSATVAYAFVFVFIPFTIFLAFTPSSNSSSPWFTNIFAKSTTSFSDESYRSHFPSIYDYFFTNSSSTPGSHNSKFSDYKPPVMKTPTKAEPLTPKDEVSKLAVHNTTNPSKPSPGLAQNKTQIEQFHNKVEDLKSNSSVTVVKNITPPSQKNNGTNSGMSKKKIDDLVKSLATCDLYDGNWVKDESYPLYKPGSCSVIDEQFNCFLNGRPDKGYYKQKWMPKGCTLPRLDGSHMLELLRGKRLVFVGDSLNRNMWESLICILRNSVKDQKKVYEGNGRHQFRGEPSYSFVFEDYNCTVEFFVTPFLVQEWEATGENGTTKETLRLDLISQSAVKYRNADIIVFNTGHWWTHEKTSLGKDYYQEGSNVYKNLNVLEAFRKATTTWARWIDANVNPNKSLVFFRGYSSSHFSGGQWNSGGQCDHEAEPIRNETYIGPNPPNTAVLEKVIRNMKTRVTYLNVTRMTGYRKDGHPSIYRKLNLTDEERRSPLSFQDCSHWCLPGVPDAWNEILYAEILVRLSHKPQVITS